MVVFLSEKLQFEGSFDQVRFGFYPLPQYVDVRLPLVQALRLGSDKLISKLKIIHHEILDDDLHCTCRGDTFLVKFLPADDVHLQIVALVIKDGYLFSQAVMGHFLKILLIHLDSHLVL